MLGHFEPKAIQATYAIEDAELSKASDRILTPEAMRFISQLHVRFNDRRIALLQDREERQKKLDKGQLPDFLSETAHIRQGTWRVADIPSDLMDRRVEITGPVDRKMIINALNSGAKVFMADFEDSNAPTWQNILQGQVNLYDAVRKEITYQTTEKTYTLKDRIATLIVRPRGLHLSEKHLKYNGQEMSGSLVDFGLFLFHNATYLLSHGTGPYFYIPKLENHLEARFWNDVFKFAQQELGIPQGSIKATVLIETILAAFEMDEILYELKEHCVGLNCGRWDYIFSFIKKFRNHKSMILPNRAEVTMTTHFLNSYAQLLIQTCHKRGAFAMGGMAAQIPIKEDPIANQIALDKVRADKEREVRLGHDGTWVAHPGLVPIAMEIFDKYMPEANQRHIQPSVPHISAQDLLQVPQGHITLDGFKHNIDVSIQYMESWLNGNGCVPIYHLMEDAATAEISRAQLWQWIHHQAMLDDKTPITASLFDLQVPSVLDKIRTVVGEDRFKQGRYPEAAELIGQLVKSPQFTEFLTLPAYRRLA